MPEITRTRLRTLQLIAAVQILYTASGLILCGNPIVESAIRGVWGGGVAFIFTAIGLFLYWEIGPVTLDLSD